MFEILDHLELGVQLDALALEIAHFARLRVVGGDLGLQLLDVAFQRAEPAPLQEKGNDHHQQRDGDAQQRDGHLLTPAEARCASLMGAD